VKSEQGARLHAIVRGSVQGVGFRYFALEAARRLGLAGWVRNRWDGAVETVAEGSRSALEGYLLALTTGPHGSHVDEVETEWLEASNEFQAFRLRVF